MHILANILTAAPFKRLMWSELNVNTETLVCDGVWPSQTVWVLDSLLYGTGLSYCADNLCAGLWMQAVPHIALREVSWHGLNVLTGALGWCTQKKGSCFKSKVPIHISAVLRERHCATKYGLDLSECCRLKKPTNSVLYSQVQMFSGQTSAWNISLLILLLDENSRGMFCSPIPKQIFLWKLRYILNTSWADYLFMTVMVSLEMALPAGQHNYAFNSFYQVVKITQMMNISIVRKSKAFNKLHWFENLMLPKTAMPVNLCK